MPEFKKGQIVVVNSPEEDDRQWHLRIYESKIAPDVHKTYNSEKESYDTWSLCIPAEEVWPNIFLGRERRAGEQAAEAVAKESALVKRLRKQIAWLCKQIMVSALHRKQSDFCPPLDMPTGPNGRCQRSCIACWELASLKAVGEDANDQA